MADRVIRAGIAGQGRSGWGIHVGTMRKYPDRFQIVAVADELSERRSRAREELGCRAYKDYRELLKDDEVEVVVNAMPNHLHPQGTIDGLRAGKHVICEKPAAAKVRDFDRMVAAAKKARRHYLAFQNNRFSPVFMKVREVIASGVLGRVVRIRISRTAFTRRQDWQTRPEYWGGTLNNTCPHFIDQMLMFYAEGRRSPKVFCRLESTPNSAGDADDLVTVTLYGPDGPVVELVKDPCQGYKQGDLYSVSATRGCLIGGGPHGFMWKYLDPDKTPKLRLERGWSSGSYPQEELPWIEEEWKPGPNEFGHRDAIYEDFYEVLSGKKRRPIVTHDQVRRQVAVLEECHRQNPKPAARKQSSKRRR